MVPRFFVPVPSSRRTGMLEVFQGHFEVREIDYSTITFSWSWSIASHKLRTYVDERQKIINEMVFVLWNFAGGESIPRRSFSFSFQNHQKLHSSTAVSINISERRGRALVPKAELKQHKNVALCKCCLSTLCVSQRRWREIFFSSQVSSFFFLQ